MSHHFHSESILGRAAFILLLMGGISWGLFGIFNINVLSAVFGDGVLVRVIYHFIGVATLYVIFRRFLGHGHEEHSH